MPLASFAALQWYGPGAGAMVTAGQGSTQAAIAATGRARSTITAAGSMPRAKGTRLVSRPATIQGAGSMPLALPKARARALATIRVNALGQDDVTGAVLEARVEGDVTLKQALRILLAHAAGDATGLEGSSAVFKSLDGTKDRIVGTYSGGTRNVTSIDGT